MTATSTHGPERPAKIVVLISGGGTNLQAIIDACNTPKLPNANVVRVVSDRKNAYGLLRAEKAGIATTYHGILPYKKKHPDDSPEPKFQEARQAFDADLAKLVLAESPDVVVCAGFMRILTLSFLKPVKEANIPVINLHPAMHGDIVGARCIEDAWEEFEQGKRKRTGIMIHYVIAELDMGAPIVQKEIDIVGCDTLKDLQDRIHAEEHPLIVEGTRRVLARESTNATQSIMATKTVEPPFCS